MRVRSDRWYSSDGQKRSRARVSQQNSSSRRLVSLVLLLALVFVMMQRAADPRTISRAFEALGVPLESEESGEDIAVSTWAIVGEDTPTDVLSKSDGPQSRWMRTCNDLVPRLLDEVNNSDLNVVAEAWFALPRAELSDRERDRFTRLRQSADEQLAQLRKRVVDSSKSKEQAKPSEGPGDEQTGADSWSEQFDRFQQEWSGLWNTLGLQDPDTTESSPPQELSAEFCEALVSTIDRRLLAMMQDGEPWRSAELIAFDRWLNKASELTEEQKIGTLGARAPRINTQQLESEHELYRGKLLRFRGSLRRCELIERSGSTGDDAYFSLWLRGDDGSAQPIAVYTLDPQAEKLAELIDASQEEFPDLEILGVGGKRLAYASDAGVQVAPTLFAGRIQQVRQLAPKAQVGRAGTETVSSLQSAWVPLAIGAALGLVVLAPILLSWKQRRVARRFRVGGSARVKSASSSGAIHSESATDGTRKGILWIALCLSLGSIEAAQVLAQDPDLPWANEDPAEAQSALLNERLPPILEQMEISQDAERPFENDYGEPADGLLQMVRLFSQLGWPLVREQVVNRAGEDLQIGLLELEGIATTVTPIELTQDQQNWYTQEKSAWIYRLKIQSIMPSGDALRIEETAESQAAVVYCQRVPRAWLQSDKLFQPVTITGVAVRSQTFEQESSTNRENEMIAGLCQAPQWVLSAAGDLSFELQAQLEPRVPQRYIYWSSLGWDLSWVDRIKDYDQKALQASEAEAFFSLLELADRVGLPKPAESAENESTAPEPQAALQEPVKALASKIDWPVRLVGGVVVPVQDSEQREFLGADFYYQWDGFVEIGNRAVAYRIGDDVVTFEREFPITIVSREPLGDVPAAVLDGRQLAWDVGRYAQVEGVFYRVWSYQSEMLENRRAKAPSARQAAPLVIATDLIPRTPPARAATVGEVGWFGLALCIAVLLILGVILYLAAGLDQRRIRQRR